MHAYLTNTARLLVNIRKRADILVEHAICAKAGGYEAHVAVSKAHNLGIYVCIFLPDRNNTPGVGFGIKFRRKEEKGFA